MKLTYIFHSGFVVESGGASIVIDFFPNPAHPAESLKPVHAAMKDRGGFYALATHAHADHFWPGIFGWKAARGDIKYVLSDDVKIPPDAPAEGIALLKKGGVFSDGRIRVEAFGSTDAGCSFLIELDGRKIFHAGDLNNWHWRDESTEAEAAVAQGRYLAELGEIARAAPELDLAMFPVDPRLGGEYMLGAEQFLSAVRAKNFAPMHFSWDGEEGYAKAAALREFAESAGARFISWTRECESAEF